MKVGDLTTLARLKAYLPAVPATAADALLSRMITSVSGYFRVWTDRDFAVAGYSETRDGRGNQELMLIDFPILSITALTVDGLVIPPRPVLSPSMTYTTRGGYTFDEHRVLLDGYYFCKGHQNVSVSYKAGYQVLNEPQTIPSSAPFTLNSLLFWANDLGVTFVSSGTALTLVTGAPAAGQYSVVEGLFTFNTADQGKAVQLSYGTVPMDIEEAVIETIAERYLYRDRIGINSKSIEGQNISFMRQDLNDNVKTLLTQYKKVGMTP